MTKRLTASQIERQARAKRETAIRRDELRHPSAPRRSPSSPTSMAIKVEDPATRAMIDSFLARRAAT